MTFDELVEPFDEVYADVTAGIKAHPCYSTGVTSAWLQTLVVEFQAERDQWEHDPEYRRYRQLCSRLRQPAIRLAAFAYLHISYDLPRVLGKNWPVPVPVHSAVPSELETEQTYFQLTPIFFDSFVEAAKRRSVTGRISVLARILPDDILSGFAVWALHLRTAAWVHARRLQVSPTVGFARASHNPRMMRAMTVSLISVLRKSWSAAVVAPPHKAFQQVSPGPIILGELGAWMLIGSAVSVLLWLAATVLQRRRHVRLFVEELGEATSRYVTLAVEDPGRFDEVFGAFEADYYGLDREERDVR